MPIARQYVRTKAYYEKERPVYRTFERHNAPRIEELDLRKEVYGMTGYREENREISFLRHISRTTNRKVRNTTVDKIIAKRSSFKESEYEPNKFMRDLIIAHGLTLLKLELTNESYDMTKLHMKAINYFDRQKRIRLEEERA